MVVRADDATAACRRPGRAAVYPAAHPEEEALIRNELVEAIREFTGAILNPFDLNELLIRLMDHANRVMPAAGAGIMLVDREDKLDFVVASDDRVVDVERLQARLQQGVCHEAFQSNGIVAVEDIAEEDRWPDYIAVAREHGFAAVLGIPLNAFGQTIGVINLYRDEPTTWTAEDIGSAEILASMGAGYILNANQLRAQHTLAEQLQSAVDSRDVIGQAKGIIMAQANVDGDRAFELLRARSQTTNRKLRDLAVDIIAEHDRRGDAAPDEDDG